MSGEQVCAWLSRASGFRPHEEDLTSAQHVQSSCAAEEPLGSRLLTVTAVENMTPPPAPQHLLPAQAHTQGTPRTLLLPGASSHLLGPWWLSQHPRLHPEVYALSSLKHRISCVVWARNERSSYPLFCGGSSRSPCVTFHPPPTSNSQTLLLNLFLRCFFSQMPLAHGIFVL